MWEWCVFGGGDRAGGGSGTDVFRDGGGGDSSLKCRLIAVMTLVPSTAVSDGGHIGVVFCSRGWPYRLRG